MNNRPLTCRLLTALVGCAAALSAGAGALSGIEDANLRDFPRLAGETDDAPRFMRATGGNGMAQDASRLAGAPNRSSLK